MAQISEESDLYLRTWSSKGGRTIQNSLSLFDLFHLCCLSRQSFLQSPTPFLESVHYLLHEDASSILFTFLSLSPIINSKLCSCLHRHSLFRGKTGAMVLPVLMETGTSDPLSLLPRDEPRQFPHKFTWDAGTYCYSPNYFLWDNTVKCLLFSR